MLGAGCGSPAEVVLQAAEAARDRDEEAYLACFTARSRAMLRAAWEAAGDDREAFFGLGAGDVLVQGVKGLAPAEAGAPERAKVALVEGGETLDIVVHAWGGRWRIDLFDTERANAGYGLRL